MSDRRPSSWVEPDWHDPTPHLDPAYSPAVEHALATGSPWTAAAIHILDGICSPMLPRDAVTMAGIDWDQLLAEAQYLSSGERLLVAAAHELGLHQWLQWSTLEQVRAGVDRDGNRRVDEAMRMVGQRVPSEVSGSAVRAESGGGARSTPEFNDPLLDAEARESFWDAR